MFEVKIKENCINDFKQFFEKKYQSKDVHHHVTVGEILTTVK
jgi:hypothetical protein